MKCSYKKFQLLDKFSNNLKFESPLRNLFLSEDYIRYLNWYKCQKKHKYFKFVET